MKRLFAWVLLIVVLLTLFVGCELDTATDTVATNQNDINNTISATNSPKGTEHIHDYVEADCVMPQTCRVCGDTVGEPNGHAWKNASCTQAKKCNVCGTTDGEPNGHDWKDATCTEAKTCDVCGEEKGNALGHNYQSGTCTRCNKSQSNNSSKTMVWIPTNGGTKYHTKSSCSNMKDPVQVTKEEAEDMGFEPCKRCH